MDSESTKDRTILIILIAFIVMTACAIVVVIIFLFFGASLPWFQSPTPQTSDATWLRIQNNGKMIVGMSADYPPFAYIDQDFTIRGYDMALIQEVGKRLNIPLEIHNMAFDGLVNAVILQQVDVTIAAMSVTPERDQVIDFTNVYYVGEEAVLAKQDSTIQITGAADLAAYRIGVQKGSVYEDWVIDTLITPGLMSPQYLYTYQTADEALLALTNPNPEIALFILDLQPAETAAQTQTVKIITHGLNLQRFAIGIPQGAYTLQERINQTLTEMQNDGTLAALSKQYLNVTNPLPLPTPEPTQPPATPSTCLDGMKFVQDLSYPDFNMTTPPQVQPGEAIQKGWRILNTGTCIWNNTYVLNYIGSAPENAPVGGNPVAIQGQVAPGQTYDIYVNIIAPAQPGTYQSFWNLRNPSGASFGDRLWAGFMVVGQIPPTPGPTTPTIYRFSVDKTQITQGQCIRLDWQFGGQNLTYTRIFRNNVLFTFDLPYTGSTTDCPPGTGNVEYRLMVDSASAGSVAASQFITIYPNVQPTLPPPPTPEQPPIIVYFTVDDADITLGQCINLSWSFSGSSLVNTQISRNDQVISNNLPPLGSQQDCPNQAGQYDYELRIDSEFSGFAQSSLFVRVQNNQPNPPVITSFTAQPDQIDLGQCVVLNWAINADGQAQANLSRNGQIVASQVSFTGSFQECINDPALVGQLNYTLQVNGAGGSDSLQTTVIVNGGQITPRSQ